MKRLIERASLQKIVFRNPDYRAYDYFLRTDSKDFIIKELIGAIDSDIFNSSNVRKLVKEHMNMKSNLNLILLDTLQIGLANRLLIKKRK